MHTKYNGVYTLYISYVSEYNCWQILAQLSEVIQIR
jgi:hypothetical protein